MIKRLGLWFALSLALAACRRPLSPPPLVGVDAQHYDLAVWLDPAAQGFQARLVLDVHHPDTLAQLPLAFEALAVDSVWVNSVGAAARHEDGRLWVPLEEGRRNSRIKVAYRGWPRVGFGTARHGPQQVVYTDSWPDEGRGWLPGLHHPADPATFTLRLTLPRGYEAVASGTLRSLDTLGAEVRYHWQLDVPVPIYAFAFAVADFSVTEDAVGDTLPVRYYMLAEDSAQAVQLRRTPQVLRFFSERFGPYAFGGYASVQVPMRFAGMENAAASFLLADLFSTNQAEEVQVHELAHQWFGNRVPIGDWADLWLSEGTATYLTTLFYEHADGLDEARRRWVDMAALVSRPTTPTPLVVAEPLSPSAILTWVPYDKGASVLHLLRRTLGDEAFFAALRATYQRYAGLPLSTTAFQEMLEAASGRDLDAVFRYWVYGNDFPTLKTHWDPATRTLSWQIDGAAGTLAGVPFALQVRQRSRLLYADAEAGSVTLTGWDDHRPRVRPVGVMIRIE